MSFWSNRRFRPTRAISRASAWLPVRVCTWSNRSGFLWTTDYWSKCDVRLWPNFQNLRQKSDEARFFFLTKKRGRPYWDERFEEEDYLVFGRETKGLPESLLENNASHCLTIPMREEARSLNLATAAGIVVYEAVRQLRIL